MVSAVKREVLFTFPAVPDQEGNNPGTQYSCQVFSTSRPLGLIMWGATPQTKVRIMVGNKIQASSCNIPGMFFETGRTFEEILKLCDAGELQLSIPQRQMITMDVLEGPGHLLSVHVVGPYQNFVMWGHEIAEKIRPAFAEIKEIERELDEGPTGYRARVVEPTFDGEREILVVEAPTVNACAALIGPRLGGIDKVRW